MTRGCALGSSRRAGDGLTRSRLQRNGGQFEPRSVFGVIASLDEVVARCGVTDLLLRQLVAEHSCDSESRKEVGLP